MYLLKFINFSSIYRWTSFCRKIALLITISNCKSSSFSRCLCCDLSLPNLSQYIVSPFFCDKAVLVISNQLQQQWFFQNHYLKHFFVCLLLYTRYSEHSAVTPHLKHRHFIFRSLSIVSMFLMYSETRAIHSIVRFSI